MKSIPRGTKKITNDVLEQINVWRKKGWSYELISVTLGISRSTIYNYCKGIVKPYSVEEQAILKQKGK